MVEGEGRQFVQGPPAGGPCVVPALDVSPPSYGTEQIGYRDVVAPGVASRVGVDPDQADHATPKAGLLSELADHRLLRPLAHFDEPPGKRPAADVGSMPPLNEQDAPTVEDHTVGRDGRGDDRRPGVAWGLQVPPGTAAPALAQGGQTALMA